MNHMSKCRNSCNSCHRPKRNTCCPIVICSFPSSATIPSGTPAGTSLTLATFTVDNSALPEGCCSLQFTSNLAAAGFTGNITFQVFKSCFNNCNNINIPVASGSYSQTAFTGTTGFNLNICNNTSCCSSNCSTFVVVATVNSTTTGTLTLSNAMISTASCCCQNNCNCCQNNCNCCQNNCGCYPSNCNCCPNNCNCPSNCQISCNCNNNCF